MGFILKKMGNNEIFFEANRASSSLHKEEKKENHKTQKFRKIPIKNNSWEEKEEEN